MNSSRHFLALVTFLLIFAAGSSFSQILRKPAQNGPVGIKPFIQLEKPRYVLGEAIRFWIGSRARNSIVIPTWKLENSCFLNTKRPDGTKKIESVGMSPDHFAAASEWRGGWGFVSETVQTGRYTLELECSGEKTLPVDLTVERNEIIDQIKAEFRFEREGPVTKSTPVAVLLVVQNNSQDSIRFLQRGTTEGVGLTIVRKQPPSTWVLGFPAQKLSQSKSMVDIYNWDAPLDIPYALLQPGEHFEQRFLLQDAYEFNGVGTYEVTFNTVISVLVGDKNGPFADVSPIRLPVTASAQFVVSSPE